MKITKEEKDNTEAILYSYKKLPSQIRQYEIDIENIKSDKISYRGIEYKEKTCKTYSVSSEVENFIVAKEKEIERLEAEKQKLIRYKEKIEIAINNFTSDQKTLFRLRYIEKASWRRVVTEMHIGKDYYYSLKKQLILSAAESLNPIRALRKIEENYKKGYYLEDDWK